MSQSTTNQFWIDFFLILSVFMWCMCVLLWTLSNLQKGKTWQTLMRKREVSARPPLYKMKSVYKNNNKTLNLRNICLCIMCLSWSGLFLKLQMLWHLYSSSQEYVCGWWQHKRNMEGWDRLGIKMRFQWSGGDEEQAGGLVGPGDGALISGRWDNCRRGSI